MLAETRAETRGALTGAVDGTVFAPDTEGVFAVTAMLSKDSSQESDIYFLNQPVNTKADGSLRFSENNAKRFYPYKPSDKLYFYAYSPAKGVQDRNDPMTVKFELTGQEDVMIGRCVNDDEGIGKVYADENGTAFEQQHPKFEFEHLLTRLNFNCRIGVGFPFGVPVTEIKIRSEHKDMTFDIKSGSIDYTDDWKNVPDKLFFRIASHCYINFYDGTLKDCEYNRICSALIPPTDEFEFYVTTSGDVVRGPYTISASDFKDAQSGKPIESFESNHSYNINLEFHADEVIITPEVEKWIDGGSGQLSE